MKQIECFFNKVGGYQRNCFNIEAGLILLRIAKEIILFMEVTSLSLENAFSFLEKHT